MGLWERLDADDWSCRHIYKESQEDVFAPRSMILNSSDGRANGLERAVQTKIVWN